MPVTDSVMRGNIWQLKKVLHCRSMKDISWELYNDLIIESHRRYDHHNLMVNSELERERKYEIYVDWYEDVSSGYKNRKKQKCCKKKK